VTQRAVISDDSVPSRWLTFGGSLSFSEMARSSSSTDDCDTSSPSTLKA
jgi:hypothetical protein